MKRLIFGKDTLESLQARLASSRDPINNNFSRFMQVRSSFPVLPRGYHDQYEEDMTMDCYSDIPERYERGEL